MLMRDINLLLPSAIRTMRSSLRDVSHQQIPFTVDGLIRQGLPEKFASQVREAAKELGGERLVVARFIEELFAMNHETFEAHESLMKWINSHDAGKGEEIKARVRGILNAWYEDEFGPGYLESVMPDDEETVQDKARIFVNHLF